VPCRAANGSIDEMVGYMSSSEACCWQPLVNKAYSINRSMYHHDISEAAEASLRLRREKKTNLLQGGPKMAQFFGTP